MVTMAGLEADVEACGAGEDEGFEASTSEGTSRPSQAKAGLKSPQWNSHVIAGQISKFRQLNRQKTSYHFYHVILYNIIHVYIYKIHIHIITCVYI